MTRLLKFTGLVVVVLAAITGFSAPVEAQLHNPCPYTNDGDCDEPNGLNLCAWGTDTADCSNPNSNFGGGPGYGATTGGGSTGPITGNLRNPCPYTNDGDCDEPNGLNLCAWGTDTADCSNPNSNFGSGSGYAGGGGNTGGGGSSTSGLRNPCPYTNDGDCDEPNGLGYCDWGTDVVDCANPNSNYGSGSGYAGGGGGNLPRYTLSASLSAQGNQSTPRLTVPGQVVITDVTLTGQEFCIWSAYGASGPGQNTGICGQSYNRNWRQNVIGRTLPAGTYFALVNRGPGQGYVQVMISLAATGR